MLGDRVECMKEYFNTIHLNEKINITLTSVAAG